jgi:hypothetical protein
MLALAGSLCKKKLIFHITSDAHQAALQSTLLVSLLFLAIVFFDIL